MTTQTKLMTAEELFKMPDDNWRYELVRGELRQMPFNGMLHGSTTARILVSLTNYVESKGLGSVYMTGTGFILGRDPDHVRAPDASFVSRDREQDTEFYFEGAPDLVVEVISPDELYFDAEEKIFDWLESGTRMVIVVLLSSEMNNNRYIVKVYRSHKHLRILTEEDTLDGGDVVPGWTMPVKDIFS